MRLPKQTVRSVEQLISALRRHEGLSGPVWYRGQATGGRSLLPSLARPPYRLEHELALITKFKQNAVPFLAARPQDEWDWLFLMRHYDVPTRLLDWTENPLVGLYFAVEPRPVPEPDGDLWALLPLELNARANLSAPGGLPAFGVDHVLDSYLPQVVASDDPARLDPVAVIGLRQFPRMMAQHSVFTITHKDFKPIDKLSPQKHIWRYVIPGGAKAYIRQQLAVLGITRLALFPELDSVGRLTKDSVP